MQAPPVHAAVLQRRLFRLAAAAPVPLAIATCAIVGGAAATVGQMLVAAHLIVSAFSSSPDAAGTTRALVWLLLLVGVRAGCAGASEWAAQRVATHAKSRLRLQVVDALVARGPVALARERTGEIVTTAMEGVEKLDPFYRRFLPQAIATAIVPLIVLAAVVWIDPVSAIVLAVTGPLIPVFMALLGKLAERRTREQWRTLSLLSGRFLDTLQGLPTLTLFGRAQHAARELADASEQLRIKTMGVLRVAFLSGFVLELTASVSTAVVAVGVGVRLIEGWLTFDAGLAALLLAPEFYLPFRQLGQRHHAGMEGVAAAERIFALTDAVTVDASSVGESAAVLPEACSIEFEGVAFTYPESTVPALRDITLASAPRTLTAIVGPSGAGKTTLLSILLRFAEPTAGSVRLNGRNAADIDARTWRRSIAFVPQRPRFVDGTVLENLRVARPDATMDEAIAATRLAQADGFITAMPHGYDTHLDETASTLSGGERQRLAIARALLKGAPVLVLDEPTSSLDAGSEAQIVDAVARIARERTVIVVAHRLSTIAHADTIVVLDGGRVVESGSHARLCRNDRAYARLVNAAQREVA